MDAPIVVIAAATGVNVELLPHPVDSPLQIAVLNLGDEVQPLALQIQIAGDEAAKVRGVSNT
jgi:hypothetical protein